MKIKLLERFESKPEGVRMLFKNTKEIDLRLSSSNPSRMAMVIINHYKENSEIDWVEGINRNQHGIALLENNLSKIDYEMLSSNPNGMHLLNRKSGKIDWVMLSSNPCAI